MIYFRCFAAWLGAIIERTLVLLINVIFGITSDLIAWVADLALFPVRWMKAYDRQYRTDYKGGQRDDQNH